jgi:hypothetical protein
MTTKKIEEKGIRILEGYFEDCDRVDTYISRNDKEPLWDGNLYLFNSAEQKADNVYGKIPTQVKTIGKTTSKDTITFSVKKTALNSYKRDGGILYFVILYNNPAERQIFCCHLTPVAIKKYLKVSGEYDSASITLRLFQTNKYRVTEDLFQFFYDCKKQTSSADKPIIELQDYFEKTEKKKFSVFANALNKVDDVFKHIQSHPLYIYATDENEYVTFAIGDGPVKLTIGHNIEQNVTINGVSYYKGCTMFEEDGEQVIIIGDFFTCHLGTRIKRGKIDLKWSGHTNFSKITFLSFCLSLFRYENFSIGQVNISCKGIIPDKGVVDRMNNELNILNKVRSLFNVLHIEGDINLDELDAKEFNNLNAFYRGLVLREPLEVKQGSEKNMRFSVGNYILYLMLYPNGDGKYQIRDFFTDEDVCSTITENDVKIKSSRFSLLDVDHFAEASNFDYSGMIASYEAFIKDDERVAQIANLDMLRMILAYDKTEGKKVKLLDAAETLNDWLIKTNRFEEFHTNEINRLQIIKRRRLFSDIEKEQIIELSEGNVTDDFKTACFLLLDNQVCAEYHFKKLPKEKKDYFKTLPIYNFWNLGNCETKKD